jgi:hypothetical protein
MCPFCPITLISDDRLLIASHIKPWVASDDFEKLVSSVETSLDSKPAESSTPLAANEDTPAAPAPSEAQITKSDEDLLKEFENLLNS